MFIIYASLDPSFPGFNEKIDKVPIAKARSKNLLSSYLMLGRKFIREHFLDLTKGNKNLAEYYSELINLTYDRVTPSEYNDEKLKVLDTDIEFAAFLDSLYTKINRIRKPKNTPNL
ncbi:MAG: hypothetical protein NZZ41_02160 [Candidatus Dojkabacteria bacterium]|nr:hypothetical protein [Candidatus Dojkabacteria bacterium]